MSPRFTIPFLLLALAGPVRAQAQEPIRFPRTPDISPDGKLVAFSYLGDIWTVEAIGGVARPVTMHEAHDINPAFSPDGRWIAFSSNRYGSYDVFVVAAHGGKPRRLTFDSAHDMVTGWTPDGKNVLFSSSRGTAFPASTEIYSVPSDGGNEHKLNICEAKDAAVAPNGSHVAYVRGPGIWYRKGYRGSSNDDVWIAALDGSFNRRVTDFNGQDGSPMWDPSGRKLYYVTELFGTPANVVCQDLTPGLLNPVADGKPRQLTDHKEDGVRRARISGNGEWIVYECGGDLWLVSTRGSAGPRKLAIEVHADDKQNTERTVTYTRDITEYALSPDEAHIAFVVHGEIFLMPSRGGKATQLTDTPAVDHGVSWSPDGKKLLFASDRSGHEDLYVLEQDDPEHPELTKAHKFKTTRLTHTPEAEQAASFTPDGSRIAFLRSGKLWTMKPDGSDAKVLVDQTQVFDYDWSPDGKWVAYARTDGFFASEVYVVPTDGSKPPVNVTRYATYNGDVSWSKTGNKLAFVSHRRGTYAMHVLSLQRPAAPGAPASSDIDWDDIHLRANRPSSMSAEGGTISPNGKLVAFRSTSNGDDLWVVSSDGSGLTRMTFGNMRPNQIRWSKGSGTIYFLDRTGSLRVGIAGVPGTSSGSGPSAISFTAKLTIRRDEEHLEMFDQAWRLLANSFYDAKHHGANWQAVRERYRPLVKHVAHKEDLYALISLMLGELNASHLGISGPGRFPDEVTADLGLIFDENYRGPGLKVAEVLKRGPADKRGVNLKPGDVVLAIDRTDLNDKANLSRLLNGKVGEVVQLTVSSAPSDPKAKRRVELQAASRGVIQDLMYQRWVAHNAEQVAKLSGGKLGYIHIPSMDEAGLEQFVRSLYSENFDKEGIVIDVRYNGGGFTHDQVLNYLGAKEHTIFRQRDGGEGLVMRSYDRKWTKPMTVLINNRSYSDAEIFPNAFRTLGLGKLVGQPTGGLVIGTYSSRLVDGSAFRVPRTGVFTLKGVNMEKEGVVPDVYVEVHPDDLAKGIDAQIVKAVEVLGRDVTAWKKSKSVPVVITPPTGGPVRPAPTPELLPMPGKR